MTALGVFSWTRTKRPLTLLTIPLAMEEKYSELFFVKAGGEKLSRLGIVKGVMEW